MLCKANAQMPSSSAQATFIASHRRRRTGTELVHRVRGEVRMNKQEIKQICDSAGFEAVERDTVYNRAERIAA
jgi:hypothetical protein